MEAPGRYHGAYRLQRGGQQAGLAHEHAGRRVDRDAGGEGGGLHEGARPVERQVHRLRLVLGRARRRRGRLRLAERLRLHLEVRRLRAVGADVRPLEEEDGRGQHIKEQRRRGETLKPTSTPAASLWLENFTKDVG